MFLSDTIMEHVFAQVTPSLFKVVFKIKCTFFAKTLIFDSRSRALIFCKNNAFILLYNSSFRSILVQSATLDLGAAGKVTLW